MHTLMRAVVWNSVRWLFFHHHTEKTNATFFRRATMQRNPKDLRPARWYWLPGWQRLAWKLAVVFGPGVVVWWWMQLTHDAAAVLVLMLALIAGNVVVAGITGRMRDRKHHRNVVEPLEAVVNNVMKEVA